MLPPASSITVARAPWWPRPQPNALPAVRDGVALEALVEEGRKLWFEDAPAGAEPFDVPMAMTFTSTRAKTVLPSHAERRGSSLRVAAGARQANASSDTDTRRPTGIPLRMGPLWQAIER
jgi:hypothetical protein